MGKKKETLMNGRMRIRKRTMQNLKDRYECEEEEDFDEGEAE